MRVRTTASAVILELSGELDIATSPPILDALTTELTNDATKTVVFDLRDVTFMDSSAIKSIIYAQNRMRVRSGNVIVCNAQPHVAKVIRILGLDHEVEVLDATDPLPPFLDPDTALTA
ncbi:MAG TPA: STAS domain-containing protein [Mycobacteriales bacterium]|nr:STAS domain-containing protein [Mycobacteriales bacterium]